MFYNCVNLTRIELISNPEYLNGKYIPDIIEEYYNLDYTSANDSGFSRCYNGIFYGCNKLSYIKILWSNEILKWLYAIWVAKNTPEDGPPSASTIPTINLNFDTLAETGTLVVRLGTTLTIDQIRSIFNLP